MTLFRHSVVLVIQCHSVVGAGRDLRAGEHRSDSFLVFVLQLVELIVNAALGEELLMCADLADLSLVHDDDLVGALNGREPVSNDQGGAALNNAAQSIAYSKLCSCVYAGSGLIQN